ncbi:MAG TPA: MFS transporter [Pseudonocardiaceae bacterium]|jgi:MFS family permease|nr:MFS transporter [Pseudonocardiaceae bacterium]
MGSRTVVVTSLAALLALAVYTAPLGTAPSVSADLAAGPVGRSWVLSSMSLGLAVFMISAGSVADELGRRRVFLAGLAVLLASVVVAGLAPDVLVFVLARIVQGVASAAIVAAGLALLAHAVPAGPHRTHATGLWGAGFGAGVALGPVFGAVAQQLSTWRWAYALLAVLTLALLLAARDRLTESTADQPRPVDLAGMATLSIALSALVAGLTEGRQGWARPAVLVLLIIAVAGFGAFLVSQRRSAHPLLDLGLWRRPGFLGVVLGAFATGAGITAAMSLLPTALQQGQRVSVVDTALILLAWSVPSALTSAAVRRLPAAWSGTARLTGTLLVVAAGLAATAVLAPDAPWWAVLPGTVVAGVATGPLNATLGRESVAVVPAGRAGIGGGVNNAARFLGASIGVTVVSGVTGTGSAAHLLHGWNISALVCAALSVLGAALILLAHRTSMPRSGLQTAKSLSRNG